MGLYNPPLQLAQTFQPGGIHDRLDFWENELCAGAWVLDLIKNGYSVPFHTEPEMSEFPNNSTVTKNPAVAEEQVKLLLQQGVLKRCSVKPHCINPLGLVSKSLNGVVKHRLIFDGSRVVNDHVNPPVVKLAYLQKACLKLSKNQLLGVFDLKSCYFHIKIRPSQTKYFGIKLDLDGIPTYFEFAYLPFGLNSAVHCVTKVWKPLIAYVQKRGVPLSVYIDDGIFGAIDAQDWEAKRKFIWQVITDAGWTIETDKSDEEFMGSMVKQYLGFLVNTKVMKLYLPTEKLELIIDLVTQFTQIYKCSAKELARVLGKMVSCIPSHGPYARVCTRSGYIDLQQAVDARGWKTSVSLSESTRGEFLLFLRCARIRNGYPMDNQLTDVRVDSIFPGAKCKNPVLTQGPYDYNAVVASDASDFKVACKWLEGPQQGHVSFTLSTDEQHVSSGERELLALLKALRHFNAVLHLRDLNFIWATDSANLVSFLAKGSPKIPIHQKVTEVYNLCHDMNCTIEPVHLLRTDERIAEVDGFSKQKDTDNWSIDDMSFQALKEQFQLSCDVFADSSNAKLPIFISKFYEQGCWAVDAFSCSWPGVAYVCPPTKLLVRAANRICKSKCEGIIILPNWPASDFFNTFFTTENQVKAPFQFVKQIQPYIFQNEGARNTPLFGVTPFSFFVLYFNTLER